LIFKKKRLILIFLKNFKEIPMKKFFTFLTSIGVVLMSLFKTGCSSQITKPLIVILLGPPGAGKGTISIKLKEKLKIPHISTGDLFRENIKKNTNLGKEAKSYMEKGVLVPDEIVENMLFERIAKKDCQKGFILDGFPRNLSQAENFEKYLQDKKFKVIVINLDVEEDILVKRISGRLICKNCKAPFHKEFLPSKEEDICDYCKGGLYQRKDDTEEVVKERLCVYNKETKPLIDFYKAKKSFYDIDAGQKKEKVLEDILEKIKEENR
jgi:adenylate kinase